MALNGSAITIIPINCKKILMPQYSVTRLECSVCSKTYEAGKPANLCECGGPLLVRYDLEHLREHWSRDCLSTAPNSMWRYAPALRPYRSP